ncbi:MAG: hypothetical protein JO083_04115 [Candidatus Eremiobacteraeota bacterium]|nr:hypothetical protein [Candidatus Eremiobacteraeota bacterium]
MRVWRIPLSGRTPDFTLPSNPHAQPTADGWLGSLSQQVGDDPGGFVDCGFA